MKTEHKTEENEQPFDDKLLPILHEGVQIVKLITFQELKKVFAVRYPHYEEQDSGMLAGSLINELFMTPNTQERFLRFTEIRAKEIESELAGLAATLAKLRPLLTDAIRIQFLCDSQKGRENPELLRIAQKLGILEEDRDVPMPARFIHLVRAVGQSYGLLAAQ